MAIFQIFINILLSGFVYLLVSLSFVLIYSSSKFFNLTHAIAITFGAYFSFLFSVQLNFPFLFSIPIAIFLSVVIGLVSELGIFKQLRIKKINSFLLLIASLGLYVILQNLISIVWGDNTKSIRTGQIKAGNEIFGAYITNTQIVIIVVSIFLFVAMVVFLRVHKMGKQIRATSSNEELANIFGIDSNRVILWSVAIGSALAATAGVLVAFDMDMTPTMGFNLLLYGIVAMIIGGVDSNWGLVGGAFLLATAQHLGAYYIDSKWMDAIAYIILILFLIWKPLGFSGKQLKKVEI